MKIIHISVVRKLTQGQCKQLSSEYQAASRLPGVQWTTIAYDDFGSKISFVHRIPFMFRMILLRGFYGWIKCWQYSKTNDYVLLRHMTFDPFSFIFVPFIKNRVSVHHAKEVEELRLVRRDWRGKAASVLERKSGAFALRRVIAIAGVTDEIARYEKDRSGSSSPTIAYPNGINTDTVEMISDQRDSALVNIAFICGTFAEWHGLDKLMKAVSAYSGEYLSRIGRIHLIGKLSDRYLEDIRNCEKLSKLFHIHGFLEEVRYREILGTCDVGLSSFALEREGLSQACTLKVRELLAVGLPIYSGHRDCAIPENFEYYSFGDEIDIESMILFGLKMKEVDRHAVSESAKPYIDKKYIMHMTVKSLIDLDRS